jgi:phage replication-related protein YjqB (UPF0714/DUF867 family)
VSLPEARTAPTPSEQVAALLAHPGVEERAELAGRFGFLAFHGGLEGGTEVVAERAARASGASFYAIVQPPRLRWHLPSHVVGRGASPALAAFLAHVDVTIAVHGYGRRERPHDILVGGANRALAADVAAALRARLPAGTVVDDLAGIPTEMRGVHPFNPVNLCRGGGVQVELPPGVRGATWRWEDRGAPCTPDHGLVEALAEVAAHSTSNVPPARQ